MKPTEDVTDAIRRAAHDWHLRMHEGGSNADHLRGLEAWLDQDPRHRAAYKRAAQLWYETHSLASLEGAPAPSRPLMQESLIAWARASRRDWAIRFAATATAFASLLLVLQTDLLGPKASFENSIETGIAETHQVTLADGSKVTLGPETHMSYDVDGPIRQTELLHGEAFFDVRSNPDRPFIVQVAATSVTVIGTSFNLRSLEEEVELSVAEGLVQLEPDGSDIVVQIEAGERVSVDEQGTIGTKRPANPDEIASWRRQRLVYRGGRLSDVVADANRYDATWYILRDPEVARMKITASFDSTDIDGMFETLEQALPISIWRPIGSIAIISAE
ncbi:MAG: FecR domain-containing protein [Pseudomonadota bacterium]